MMQPPATMGAQPGTGSNAMQDMMQQMMQNPAMMQQSMQMAQQMFGGGGMGMGMQPPTPVTGSETTLPSTSTPPATPNPFGMQPAVAGGNGQMNPFAAMMQQMMPNAGMMQPNPALLGMNAGTSLAPPATPMTEQMQRMRFASQLTQLTMMGFTNEAACLHALAQHNGRIDAAIDTLLSSGSS